MEFGMSMNVAKSMILLPFGRLVRHIILEHIIVVILNKIAITIVLAFSYNFTKLKGFLGHTRFLPIYIYIYIYINL